MSQIKAEEGNADRTLSVQDYNSSGELNSRSAELALVVGSARRSQNFIDDKQWSLLWRDADLLFQSPRPMSVFENTYILEPNVTRFTVAKVVNAIVPQLYKGLFYTDPPMVLRPRPGVSQNTVDAKTALFSELLDQCNFKTETKWGLEQMTHLGTGIWKWGIKYEKIYVKTRTAQVDKVTAGPTNFQTSVLLPKNVAPDIKITERLVPRPAFESRELSKVLVDPHTPVGDIRQADYAIDVRYMSYYDLRDLALAIEKLPDDHPDKKGWFFPDDSEMRSWWFPPTDAGALGQSSTDQATYVQGVVHHAELANIETTPDLLMKKLEVYEYWDKRRTITVIDKKKVLCSKENTFGVLPFLSANWWNRPKSFYGMGLGLIVGQNQRVDQGTINAVLKMLSFGVNPIYLRKRDSNAPTQMIRTGIGKVLTVDSDVKDAYGLLEIPKVPAEVWSALSESNQATESSSGADQTLVQGSSAGPRAGMGRTATGASQMGAASATRLDGPLDNFIEQVFKPFLYILDMLVFTYFPDTEIFTMLGEVMGKDYMVDLQEFHSSVIDFEVLAGASLSAKRTMSQSMTLIEQIFTNPSVQENLAEINQEYVDVKQILKMWMEASEWKDFDSIVKPMTQDMIQRRQAQSEAAQAQSKAAVQTNLLDHKAALSAQQQQADADNRIKRDLVVEAFRNSGQQEATEGTPSFGGIDGSQATVE
jgi:hypothetical protein